MSSTNGLAGEEDYAHYNASKGGVLLLTKTMAVELGRHGIRVTRCAPAISTPR
jgi:3-oxoacyl-[acyl-carrier protein] reductase